MKKYLVLLFVLFFVMIAKSQKGFGLDVGIGTSKAPMIAVKYFFDKNAVSIGGSYQIFNDALGKKTEGMVPGTIGIDDGDFFYSLDFGYTRVITEKFFISADVSIGKRKFFYNFSDDNLSAGGYHYFHKIISEGGVGAYLTYNFSESFGMFAGYNTMREGTFGLEFRFLHEKQY